jgi:chaperonin GroEL
MLILVEDIPDDVLALMVVNKIKGNFNFCVVRTRNMDDIAVVTGAQIVTEEAGGKFTAEMLGYADKVETGKYFCQVTGGKEDQETVDAKIEELKKVREIADNEYDAQVAAMRIARLQGGVSIIRIAGTNEQQTKEKKLKLEDALNSVKSSMDEGIIEGGGMSLYRATEELEFVVRETTIKDGEEKEVDVENSIENQAARLVCEVIQIPFKQILINADEDVEEVLKTPRNKETGYNVVTRQWENFYESGIIDPVKAVKRALINAFAMGTSIMTAEAGIIVMKEKK